MSVTRLTGTGGTCNLDSTSPYHIPAFTKCTSWSTANPTMQLAFRVAGDCSIQISPITDKSCADPTDIAEADVTDDTLIPYGKIEMRGYYHWDDANSKFVIRSLFDTATDPATGAQVTK